MKLVKLDESPEATGEQESPWCAGENPGVSPRDFDQRACRTSGACTSGLCGGILPFHLWSAEARDASAKPMTPVRNTLHGQ